MTERKGRLIFLPSYTELFEPLKDKEFFSSFTLEGHTLSWSNGADFAPEFLREQISCTSVPVHH
jgi:hypothetical protein